MEFVLDRDAYEGASALIAAHGPAAAMMEAAARAGASRSADNPYRQARWHRVGRAILAIEGASGSRTRH